MNPLELIQTYYERFTKTEKNIAIAILNDPKNFARGSIDSNIDALKTSKAALIRFAKKIGYSGYVEFKFDLSRFLVSHSFDDFENTETNENPIRQITNVYCDAIKQMDETLDLTKIIDIAQHILNARKVKVLGIDRTSLSARQLQMRCLKIGIDVAAVDTTNAILDLSSIISAEDYCIIFSIKDNGKIYKSVVDALAQAKCKTTLVTMTPQLPFAKNCHHIITLPHVSKGYAKFIDEQALYFIFVEILLNELALLSLNKN